MPGALSTRDRCGYSCSGVLRTGHRDIHPQVVPCLVESPVIDAEVAVQVACGNRHTVVRTGMEGWGVGKSVGVVGYSPLGISEGRLTEHSVEPSRDGQLGTRPVVYNNIIFI